MLQSPSQEPTRHGGPDAIGIDAWPIQKEARSASHSLYDEGMVGAHTNDHVMLLNAHPHQEHSVGYHEANALPESYNTHGFDAVHIIHGKRDKAPEHHPPKGLMDHGIVGHSKKTKGVFTDG